MRRPLLAGETLGASLTHLAAVSPGSTAVFPTAGPDGTAENITARDLDDSADGAARALLDGGVVPGDVVGVMVPPSARLFATLFGVWRSGAAASVLPVQAGFGDAEATARRLARIAGVAGMRHLVLDDDHAEIGARLRQVMPELTLVSPHRAGAGDPGRELPPVEPDAVAVVQFTSGSTSAPKGVVLPHRAVIAGLRAIVVSGEFSPDDVFVQWVPVFHDMGLIGLMSHWLNGADVHVFTPTAFLRRPAKLLDYFAEVGGTVITGPNFGYEYILDAVKPEQLATLDLAPWRLAFNGSEPVDAQTVERFATTLAPCGLRDSVMFPVYGMAEATLAISFPKPGTVPRVVTIDRDELAATRRARAVSGESGTGKRVVSVGRAVHGIELRIVGPDGAVVEPSGLGEIQIRGDAVTTGYLGDRDATERLFDGPWLRTGDLGFELDGDLFVAGRLKEMVIVRGQNFFPDDVEAIAREVPGVYRRRCVAFTDTDADGAEHIGVIVEARTADGEQVSTEVARRVSAELDLAQVRVHIVQPRWLTRTTSGKWQRAIASHRLESATREK